MKPAMKYACACFAFAVSLATIVATLATAQQPTARVSRPVETTDPIERFAELMPVITHARCMGCHTAGITRSYIGEMELRSGKWKLAPRHVAFVGKDTKDLCRQFANDARIRSHLMGDELIGLAFVGRRGDATEHADPPPMTRNELVEAADRWLTKDWAKCGRWNGKIAQKEEFRSNYSYPMPVGNGSTTSVQEVASREITIWRKNGVTMASVNASGSSTIINTMRLDGPNGPCTAVATSTGRWHSTASPNGQPDLSITIDDNGGSTIRFATPAETGNSGSSGDIVNDCGIPFPADGGGEPPVQLEWPSWVFMIRCPSDHAICQLFDPEQPRLSGTMERTITDHSDAAEPQSWLTTGPVGISRSDDGTSIPVKVTTTWDLTLEN